MAGRKLAVNTTALDETGRMVTFLAGTTVSAEVAEGITNPNAWEAPEAAAADGDGSKPAKKAAAKRSSSK
jgi:hypothetical protein